MATNFFFNNHNAFQEQDVLEDLIVESIKIYGLDMYYLPRVINNYDDVYGADDISSYDKAYTLEMYIRSIDGFSGDRSFFSKFGVEIRDQVIFSVAKRSFSKEVGARNQQQRPNEGDLIYFPLNSKMFQIKYVEKHEMFYQLGKLYTWELTCELFEFSGERFNTGIPTIDNIYKKYHNNIYDWALLDESGTMLTDESNNIITVENSTIEDLMVHADNEDIETEADTFIDFSEIDPFSEGNV